MSHVVQTDHRVLRKSTPTVEADSAASANDGSLTYFADTAAQFSPVERQRGLALGTYAHCTRKGIPIPNNLASFMEQLLDTFPNDMDLLNTLGQLALQRGDLEMAKRYQQRALVIEPDNETALDGLMAVAYSTSNWAECLDCATRLLDIDPSSTRVHAIRGDALANLGKIEEGIAEIERATELNPGATELYQWLADRYRQTGQADKLASAQLMIERLKNAKIPPQAPPAS
ncbi:MAG: hypothetical protein R3C53_27425 [Pirellulaceae bacterium]